MRTLAAAALLAAVTGLAALALAGCGRDSGSALEKGPLSAATWRREVNGVCRDVGRTVRATPLPTGYGEIESFVATTLPLWRQQEERIRALVPPRKLAGLADSYLDSLSSFEAALVEIHVATQRNDGERRVEAQEKAQRWAFYMKRAAAIIGGLPACARQRAP